MGELEKIKIIAYKDDTFSGTSKIGEEFKGAVNPESYKESFNILYSKYQPIGTSGSDLKYIKTLPGSLSLKILFDSTGIFTQVGDAASIEEGVLNAVASFASANMNAGKDIMPEIEKFMNLVFHMNGTIHEPHYLNIIWGKMDIKCRMTKLDIDYKIFNSNGNPIRAIATLELERILNKEEQDAITKPSSPDLTHIRYTKAGDTLPLLCYSIYRDTKYYLEVARVNKLRDFRRLKPGQEIFFPPLKKTNE